MLYIIYYWYYIILIIYHCFNHSENSNWCVTVIHLWGKQCGILTYTYNVLFIDRFISAFIYCFNYLSFSFIGNFLKFYTVDLCHLSTMPQNITTWFSYLTIFFIWYHSFSMPPVPIPLPASSVPYLLSTSTISTFDNLPIVSDSMQHLVYKPAS